jgi:hypothetical protein
LAPALVGLLDDVAGDVLGTEAERDRRGQRDPPRMIRNVGAVSCTAMPSCVRAANTA